MKINKALVVFCGLTSLSTYAQKTNEYKFLFEGLHNSKVYSKFESKDGDKIKVWYKIEETIESSPGISFTEYYLQVDCKAKTYMLNGSTNYWRDGTVQKVDPPNAPKVVPIVEPNSIAGITYQKYCVKK